MSPRLATMALAPLLAIAGQAQQAEHLEHRGPITAIAAVEGGLLGVSQAGILFHPGREPEPARVFALPGFRVRSIAVAANGSVWVAGGIPGESASIATITTEAREQWALTGHRDMAYAIAIAPTGDQIAVAHADGSVRVAAAGGTLAQEPWKTRHRHTAPAVAVQFSADGRRLASGGLDGVLVVSGSDAQDGTPRHLDEHTAGVECLAFSPDGTWLASGSRDSKVRIHEAATGRLVRTFSGLGMEDEPVAGRVTARITAIAWSGAGLFAGTSKGTAYHLSETDDGRRLLRTDSLKEPVTALLTVEGHLIIAAGGRLRNIALSP